MNIQLDRWNDVLLSIVRPLRDRAFVHVGYVSRPTVQKEKITVKTQLNSVNTVLIMSCYVIECQLNIIQLLYQNVSV